MALTRLIELTGGEFLMGSNSFYPEEWGLRHLTPNRTNGPICTSRSGHFVDLGGYGVRFSAI
ncbi:MAG: hypothetical protein P4L86_10290 [Mycobacterium sp.]|nr:hypothetical protein [Mycobacterium sp.]